MSELDGKVRPMTRATDGKPGAKHLGLDLSLTAIAVPSLLFSLDSVSQVEYPAGR